MLMGQDSKMVGIILYNSKVGQSGEQEFLRNNNNNKVFQGELSVSENGPIPAGLDCVSPETPS